MESKLVIVALNREMDTSLRWLPDVRPRERSCADLRWL